ncbi:cytochrome c oxidase assembly factor 8 [Lampris incognitus]|uniref:cytochrome c oxidase assembly factor 8 n=1 Tax=Lampris incognitus TaxID=2546036 RepID=UPI0024B5A10F|nr:cytochrome c oxidase assembly factor 8 [Lampris incognitus]
MASRIARRLTWKSRCPCSAEAPRPRGVSAVVRRQCSSKQAITQETLPKRSPFRPAPNSMHDWIGPPNPLSNLRPIIYHIHENETELEKRLRNLRQETEDWNHDFWTNQNISFRKEKDAFIISQLKKKGLSERDEQGRKRALDSEEMAVFYKSFLDQNKTRHANYNKEWYRRNFTITLLMGQVTLRKAWKTITERHSDKKKGTSTT